MNVYLSLDETGMTKIQRMKRRKKRVFIRSISCEAHNYLRESSPRRSVLEIVANRFNNLLKLTNNK